LYKPCLIFDHIKMTLRTEPTNGGTDFS
jgi:hypothetical protein